MSVTRHLYIGADRPTTYSELAERMGVTHREAMQAVQEARLALEPIVSGPRGLWISDSPEEVAQAAESLRKRLVTQYATVRALRATARRMARRRAGQGVMPWAA